MALEEDEVPVQPRLRPAEEVVEAHLVKLGDGGVGGDVPPDAVRLLVGPGDHHGHVPAEDVGDAALQLQVPGVRGLFLLGEGVEVGGGEAVCGVDPMAEEVLVQKAQELLHPLGALHLEDVFQRLQPLPVLYF